MIELIADGRTDLVVELLELSKNPKATDSNGTSIIQWCAYYGDVTAIKHLLSHGAELTDLGGNKGLMGAAFHGHWQLCQFLLEQGADANFVDKKTGETALHAACSNAGRAEFKYVVQVLLNAGADPNLATIPNQETGSFMRDVRTKGESPLHRAAAFADKSTIQALIDAGADIKQVDHFGDSPLSWASWHCRPDEILKLLCFDEHWIHPDRDSKSDHGQGQSAMQEFLLGKPHLK